MVLDESFLPRHAHADDQKLGPALSNRGRAALCLLRVEVSVCKAADDEAGMTLRQPCGDDLDHFGFGAEEVDPETLTHRQCAELVNELDAGDSLRKRLTL